MRRPLAFISYSTDDSAVARQIARGLRARKVDVWIDEDEIRVGDSIPTKISEGLAAADAVLVLVSEHFLASSWCRAEYEPLVIREIERDRSFILPLRLDDAEMPVLLSAKRYLDMRLGATDSLLDELAAGIAFNGNRTCLSRLVPAEPGSFEVSVLSMIVSGVLEDFSVPSITLERLRGGYGLVDVYRAVDRLIERYQDLFDTLAETFSNARIEERFYGSALRVAGFRRSAVNRKLRRISADMQDLADSFACMIESEGSVQNRLAEISQICAQVSEIEDVLVLQLRTRAEPRVRGQMAPWVGSSWPDIAAYPDLLSEAGGQMMRDYARILDQLDDYRRQLRIAVARASTTPA